MYNDTGITFAYMINKYTINTNVNTAGQYSVQTKLQMYIDKSKRSYRTSQEAITNRSCQTQHDSTNPTQYSATKTQNDRSRPGSLPLNESDNA